jgi:hypothetical protein
VLSGCSGVELHRNGTPIETDGPRRALRYFGYNPGRYERYGIVFRTMGEESGASWRTSHLPLRRTKGSGRRMARFSASW